MNTLPTLTEAQIRRRTTEKSCARAEGYFDRVHDLVWRDGELTAQVDGSDFAPYRVRIRFADQTLAVAACSCPYAFGGDCKHIVAVLLTMQRQPEGILQRPALADLLQQHDRAQLIALLFDLVALHPELIDEIDALASHSAAADRQPRSSASSPAVPPPIDAALLMRQIMADMRSAVQSGYDSWGQEAWYDSDLAMALEPALQHAWTSLEREDPRGALAILRTATEAWNAGAATLDDYVREYFIETMDESLYELAECWAEAILLADLDAGERTLWVDYFDEKVETSFGGDALAPALTAAKQGWDYPPLVAAMGGDITEKGAWEEEAPIYADMLAEIRLRILDQRGDYTAYLNLAQAEGQFMAYLHMLVRRQQSELAVQEAMEYLNDPADLLALAETLLEQGEAEKAFALAQHGLALPADRQKGALAAWLRDAAAAHEQPNLALDAAQQALHVETTLANYQALQAVAGAAWSTLQPEILRAVVPRGEAESQVDIYLYEGMHDEAIAAVDAAKWFYNVDPVIEAVHNSHPEWAFQQCCRPTEKIMNAGRSKDYDVAVSRLRRGRDILMAAGRQAEWGTYLAEILVEHERKYKLVPLLKQLRL